MKLIEAIEAFQQPNIKLITNYNKENIYRYVSCDVDGFTINNNGPKLNET